MGHNIDRRIIITTYSHYFCTHLFKSISLVQNCNGGVSRLTASALEMHVDSFYLYLQTLQTQHSHAFFLRLALTLINTSRPLSLSPMFPSTATLLTTLATVEHRRFAAGSTISAPSLSASTIYCHVGNMQQSHSRSAQTGTLWLRGLLCLPSSFPIIAYYSINFIEMTICCKSFSVIAPS